MSETTIDERTFTYVDRKGKEYSLTVGYANILMDTRRGVYQYQADQQNQTEPDRAVAILRRYTYPDCVAATTQQEGFAQWPPSIEEFCLLEPGMVKAWSDAAYQVNPNWKLAPDPEEERQKKA